MTAHTRLPQPLVESIRKALTRNALPGETQDLSRDAESEAAEFLAKVAGLRKRGELALAIEFDRRRGRAPQDENRHRQRRHAVPRGFRS